MIDCTSNFDLLISLLSTVWISAISAFELSLECLMYQVSMRSCRALTNVYFFIFSSVTPCASHILFITNQNWYRSSFLTPLNTGNFIALAILNYGGGGGGVGEDGGEDGETSGGVGGSGMHGICCFIKLITLLGATFASSSSLSCGGEIKGLVTSSTLPSFL